MNRNRKTMLAIGGLFLIASLVLVAFMLQPSAAELLTEALQTMEAVTDGHAIIEVQVNTPELSGSSTVEAWGQLNVGPNGEPAFRVEVSAASEEEALGMVAVSDGSQFWLWYPSRNTVYTATGEEAANLLADKLAAAEFSDTHSGEYADFVRPETADEAVALLLEYFTAERTDTEDVDGTAAYKIRLVPIAEQMPEEVRAAGGFINAWIGTESRAPLAVEYTQSQVGVYGKATATTLELNQGVDSSRFTFEIPEGADIVNLIELANSQMVEKALPPDFDTLAPPAFPPGATLIDESNVRGAFVQRYALSGGGSFTVAQGPAEISYQPEGVGSTITVRGEAATLYGDADGIRSLVTWTEGDMSFWIGGDLSPDEAISVAESMR
jgi:outer membrane lipoprotein-sorting protein